MPAEAQTFDFEADALPVMDFLHRCLDGWSYWLLWSRSRGQQSLFDDTPFGFLKRGDKPPHLDQASDGERRLVRAEWVPSLHDASCLFCIGLRVTVVGGPFQAGRAGARCERLETDIATITLTQQRLGLTTARLQPCAEPIWYQTNQPVEGAIVTIFSQKIIPLMWTGLLEFWREEANRDAGPAGPELAPPSADPDVGHERAATARGRARTVATMVRVGANAAVAALLGVIGGALSPYLGGVGWAGALVAFLGFLGVQIWLGTRTD